MGVLKLAKAYDRTARLLIDENKLDVTVAKLLKSIKKENVSLYELCVTGKVPKNYINEDTLLVVLDVHSPTMVMRKDIVDKVDNIVVIDHHRKGESTFENTRLQYIEPSASSTVEIVTELFTFMEKQVDLTPYEATIMLAGLVVDTNYFTFRTGTRTFEAASILKDAGADMLKVRAMLREDVNRHMLVSTITNSVKIYNKYFAVACSDNEFVVDRTILAQVSDNLLEIEDVDASFTIGRLGVNEIGISARSLDIMNVQTLMEELGGGGHFNNAAVQIENVTVDDVLEMLKPILAKNSREGENVKVILLEDVKGKGSKDDVVEVTSGYANHLIREGQAIDASPTNLKKLKEEQEKHQKNEQDKKELIELLKKDT